MTETIEQRAERLVRQEVQLTLSAIVATLAMGGRTSAVRPRPDSALKELCDQASDLAAPIDDWEEAAIQDGAKKDPEREGYYFDDKYFNTAEEWCEERGLEPYQREVFEFWAVSQWLGDKLRERGEKVDDDFAGLVVWARTTSGQGISGDRVIQEIAASVLR